MVAQGREVLQGEADEQGVVVARKRPLIASRSWGILTRSRPLASSARTLGSRSPAISALSIGPSDCPSTSEATESSLMPASSRVFCTRCSSEEWAWMSRLR